MHLATSARSICVFWIKGISQFIVYLPHADKYILHPRPTLMIEAAKPDKNGLCRVPWSVLAQRYGGSMARKYKSANQKRRKLLVDSCSQSQECEASKYWRSVFDLTTDDPDVSTKCWRSVFDLTTDDPDVSTKLPENS